MKRTKITQFLDSNEERNNYRDRSRHYKYLVPEELYDTEQDPGCRQNLIHDPAHTENPQSFRHKMLEFLRTTKDAELPKYTAYVTLEGRLPCLTNN